MASTTDTDERSELLDSLLCRLEASGLNRTELRMLIALRGQSSTSVMGLGRRAGVSAAVASREVERLLRRGFVDRRADPSDRRRCIVSLSGAGRAELDRVETELRKLFGIVGG